MQNQYVTHGFYMSAVACKQSILKADVMLNYIAVKDVFRKCYAIIYPVNLSLKGTGLYESCVFCNMGTYIMFVYMTVFM